MSQSASPAEIPSANSPSASPLVNCVTCDIELPMAKADIVGMGYRCPPCGQQASIKQLSGRGSDVADHLTPDERRANMERFRLLAIGGAGITAVALVMIGVGLIKSGFILMCLGLAELVWSVRGYLHNRG